MTKNSTVNVRLDIVTKIFVFSVILKMFLSFRIYITWMIPDTLVNVIFICSSLFFIFSNRLILNKRNLGLAGIFFILQLYQFLFAYDINFPIAISLSSSLLGGLVLILSDNNVKKYFLSVVTNVTAAIIVISLIGWIPHLLGVKMPHYYSDTSAFYKHEVYYLFLDGVDVDIFPRFRGWFLEPGHLATTCIFLLYANKYDLKRKQNVIFLVGTLLSLSLAGYGLLLGGWLLYFILQSRKGILNAALFALIIGGATVFVKNYNGGNNGVNNLILDRLAVEDGNIVGNNRFSSYFEYRYERYLKTDEKYVGIRKEVYTQDESQNWTIGSAGWKRYILNQGYIGTGLVIFFYLMFFLKYKSSQGFGFFILTLVANAIRDYPLSEYWLYIYILVIINFYMSAIDIRAVHKIEKI